jgi:hypothetical protein
VALQLHRNTRRRPKFRAVIVGYGYLMRKASRGISLTGTCMYRSTCIQTVLPQVTTYVWCNHRACTRLDSHTSNATPRIQTSAFSYLLVTRMPVQAVHGHPELYLSLRPAGNEAEAELKRRPGPMVAHHTCKPCCRSFYSRAHPVLSIGASAPKSKGGDALISEATTSKARQRLKTLWVCNHLLFVYL